MKRTTMSQLKIKLFGDSEDTTLRYDDIATMRDTVTCRFEQIFCLHGNVTLRFWAFGNCIDLRASIIGVF